MWLLTWLQLIDQNMTSSDDDSIYSPFLSSAHETENVVPGLGGLF